MSARLTYTVETVERALNIHKRAGRIGWWDRSDRPGRWVVSLNCNKDLELRSLREAYVFVNGMATASVEGITT